MKSNEDENKEEIKKTKISPKQDKSDKKASKTEQNKDNMKKKQEELKDAPVKDKSKPQKGKAPLQDHDKPKVSVAPVAEAAKSVKGEVFVPWVDKYKPKTASQLVGQHGDKSPLNKLLGWLKDWGRNNLGEGGRIKKPKPPPFLAQSDGAPFKAILLSGSPGVGKTTCAVMACESLGWKTVEMNASDVRNKKSLEQQITQLTESHQIEEYFTSLPGGAEEEVKHALIMDEVDGMSGTEDRAGVAELIQIIKDTKIPIICICNDRQHPKIRSLANYCFDVRFPKPRVEQIRARLMSIACQEKVKISKEELDQMIEMSGHDVRQSIYNLQLYASAGGKAKVQKKDVAVGPFEAARKLLDSRSTLQEKQDMFFVDYSIMPLFVQENYPNMRNDKHSPKQAMAGLRRAADLISHGDTIERCIRSTGTWKLLNEQAMLGCALPSIAVDGHLRAMIQFPAWLGKNSTANKRQRLMRQLATHAHLKISADMHSLVADYVPVLRDCLTKPLLERETDGVFEVVCTMTDYDLVREDSEAVSELAVWPGKVDPASKILPKVKAALTRALNKEHRMLPYATEEMSKGRRRGAQADYEVEVDEDGNLIERLDEDESGYEDDSGDEDYKPGGKSKPKAKPAASAQRGRGRGASAGASSRGGARRGRGK
ncbi:replication factor RFC1 domain protein [Ancylostoma duodenale]|uniref:Replication factor RFC1 domain protein n=1 Tax=Ancylostoma duodenale TaxID=51022 RepID=A0A0C2CA90_9BILA|nr:replication factor RFC1 domain protein [Ancylostoma duodenale]